MQRTKEAQLAARSTSPDILNSMVKLLLCKMPEYPVQVLPISLAAVPGHTQSARRPAAGAV